MARATKEQLEQRKENALTMLDQHTDEYRTWYAKIAGLTDPKPSDIADLKTQRALMDIKADAIHTQIRYLDELIATYADPVDATAEMQ